MSRQSDERLALVRDLVVEAALEVLDRDGLGLQAEAISYAKVFALLEEHGVKVSRGSVHGRIWDSHEDFRIEVLTAATIHNTPRYDGPGVHEPIIAILEAIDQDHPDLDRRSRVQAFCRVAGHVLLTGYLHSARFKRFQSIKAAARVGADTGANEFLRAMIRQRAEGNQAERAQTFRYMFNALGLQGRRELGMSDDKAIDLFMTLVQVLISGAHLDYHAGAPIMASKVETDLPAGEDSPWTYFGFGFLAFMETLFEPKSNHDPSIDPAPKRDQVMDSGDDGEPVQDQNQSIDLSSLISDKPRRSRNELRQLVVAAGVKLLLRDGLGLRAESLSYSSVFTHIRETRGISVHRSTVHPVIWASQEDFRADVLAESVKFGTGESHLVMKQAMAAQQIARNPDGSANLRQIILDSSRVVTMAQMRTVAASPTFRRWQSIKASVLSRTPAENADGLQSAVGARYDEVLTNFANDYRSMLPLVGLRPNPDLKMTEDQTYHLFASLCATLATGSEFNISAGAMAPERTVPLPRVDDSGSTDEWPITAVGTQAVLDLLFVPKI